MSDLFEPRHRFAARWIWGPHDPAPHNVMRLFRCDFTAEQAAGCVLRITADTRYRLWLNGEWLGRGSAQSFPWLMFHDRIPLDAVVRAGTNQLAVEVYSLGIRQETRAGLLAEVVDAAGRVLCASGGPGWWTRPDPAWTPRAYEVRMNQRGRFQEFQDLRRDLRDWQTAAPGPGWDAAQTLEGRLPWTLVVPRCCPPPVETPLATPRVVQAEECQALDRHHPDDLSVRLSQAGRPLQRATVTGAERLHQGGELHLACAFPAGYADTAGIHDPCLVLDAGRVVTAYLEIDCTAAADAELSLGFAERLVDGRFSNAIECQFAAQWICRAGRQTLRLRDWRAFRYLRLRLGACPAGLTIHALRVVRVAQDLGPAAPFACGDARLTAIRDLGLASLQLCCVDGIYDTPHREGAQWLGDVALVSVPLLQQVHDARGPVAQWLRQSHAGRTPSGFLPNLSNIPKADPGARHDIPDYSLWWLWALGEHHRHTGDRRWVDHCWPGVLGLLAAHRERVGADGLVHDIPGWLFIDWAPVGRGPTCAAYNAILALALQVAIELAAVRGDTHAGAEAGDLLAGIRRGFGPTFWDQELGLVRDHPLGTDGPLSEHANAAALWAGLLDADQAARVVAGVFRAPQRPYVEAEPFFMSVVLHALLRAEELGVAGARGLGVELVRERWGRMLDQGASSALEEWGENGSWRLGRFTGFQRTHSHAWSGCPGNLLPLLLGGIEPTAPGGQAVRARPLAAPWPYTASRRIGAGLVTVRWDGERATVDAPDGVAVTQEAPVAWAVTSTAG